MSRPVLPCTFARALGRPPRPSEPAPDGEPIEDADASLAALTGTLIPLLDRYDVLWAETSRLYVEAGKMVGSQPPWDGPKARWDAWTQANHEAREKSGYYAAWERSNAVCNEIQPLIASFMDTPARTLRAIVLKWRLSESIEHYEGAAIPDLRRLWDDET